MHPTVDDVPNPDRWCCTVCGYYTVTQPRERMLGGWVIGFCGRCDRTVTASPVRLTDINPNPPKRKRAHI